MNFLLESASFLIKASTWFYNLELKAFRSFESDAFKVNILLQGQEATSLLALVI